jgi:uncharacterized protein (DUF362 family)/Pyruvate/2-oxoacid:ferredoxin oxidoreductase delta subunit
VLAVSDLSLIKKGTRVAIKANLVASATPDAAVTTHPAVLSAICELVVERGASVVIGDSPGGLYNAAFLDKIYKHAGVCECEKYGAALNRNFGESNAVYDEAKVAKTFTYTSYLDDADVIINACKLKTHGMMGLSCAAKNIFGVIPGTMKPEYHFRYPSYEAFADMIVDLDEYFKPYISVCDAVVGMEGNGPTAGTPRGIGCILAASSPHKLDAVAAAIIGLKADSVPTLEAAKARGLLPATISDISIFGDYTKYQIFDYKNIAVKRSLQFKGNSDNVLKNIFGNVAKGVLDSKPKLNRKSCIGCNKCGKICPAKAIVIKNGKAEIDRSKCIKCFCCQEFCPVGAMKVHRTFIARLLQRR